MGMFEVIMWLIGVLNLLTTSPSPSKQGLRGVGSRAKGLGFIEGLGFWVWGTCNKDQVLNMVHMVIPHWGLEFKPCAFTPFLGF